MTDNEHWNIRHPLQSIWNPSNKISTKEDEIKGLISIIAGYQQCQKSYEEEIKQLNGTIETLQFVVELNKKYALKLGASISDW